MISNANSKRDLVNDLLSEHLFGITRYYVAKYTFIELWVFCIKTIVFNFGFDMTRSEELILATTEAFIPLNGVPY